MRDTEKSVTTSVKTFTIFCIKQLAKDLQPQPFDGYLEQLYTFGDPHRDPRGRVVTVAYYALVPTDKSPLLAGTDAATAGWYPVSALPPLAFDHKRIIEYAVDRLRNKLEYTNVG